jgi:hypothetical protein
VIAHLKLGFGRVLDCWLDMHLYLSMTLRFTSTFLSVCLALFVMVGCVSSAEAGTRFWVGGTGEWDASSTDHWSETSGGVGGASVPSSMDDVVFDAASHVSEYTVTITAPAQAANLTIANPATGAITVTGSAPLSIFGSFSGPLGGVWSHTGTVTFAATSMGNTMTFNGMTFGGPVVWDGMGGGWTLQDSFAQVETALMTQANGVLDTNGQGLTLGSWALGVGTKGLVLGSSTITIHGLVLDFSTNNTGFTFDAGTSSITFDKKVTGRLVFALGGNVFYDVSVIQLPGGFTPLGNGTFHDLLIDARLLGAGNRVVGIDSGATWNVNGVFTYIGFDAAKNRGRFRASTSGVSATVALGATGSVIFTNIDFSDIVITGATVPVMGTSLGDCGGNEGITMSPAVTRYWVGDTGVMSSADHWAATSGGLGGASVPLPQDTAVWDAHSFTTEGGIVHFDMLRIGTMDFSEVTNHPVLNYVNPYSSGHLVFGSVVYSPNMSVTVNDASGGTDVLNLNGRGKYIYSGAGLTLPTNFRGLNINAPDGTYTLGSDLYLDATRTLNLVAGTFDAATHDVSIGAFASDALNTRTLKMGSGTWRITGSGNVWNTATSAGMTLLSGSSTLLFTDATAGTKTIAAGTGVASFYRIWITGNGSGKYVFSLPLTAVDFKDDNVAAHTLEFLAGSTYTFTNWQVHGSAGNNVALASTHDGSFFRLVSNGSDPFRSTYLSIKDSQASGGAGFFAVVGSVDVGGNSGWIFGNVPEVLVPPVVPPVSASIPVVSSGGGATTASSATSTPVTFSFTGGAALPARSLPSSHALVVSSPYGLDSSSGRVFECHAQIRGVFCSVYRSLRVSRLLSDDIVLTMIVMIRLGKSF